MTIHANARAQRRGMNDEPRQRGARRRCGHCAKATVTHAGFVQAKDEAGATVDVVMTTGCEWCIRQWVRDPRWRFKREAGDVR